VLMYVFVNEITRLGTKKITLKAMQTAAIYKIFCSDDISIALIGLNWRKMPSFVVCQNGKNMCSGKWKMHD